MSKSESICRKCFHSYVCEQFNKHRDDDNQKCRFNNDHFVSSEDVVKVVRCKDCKDYIPVMFNNKPMHYGYCCNTHDDILGNRHRYEGDFCSYGELKECEG